MNSEEAGAPPSTEQGAVPCYCPRCDILTLCLTGTVDICPRCQGHLQNMLRMRSLRSVFPVPPYWDNENNGDIGDIPQIPTVQVNASDVSTALECPICLEEFVSGEEVSKTDCSHCFHRDCIDPWLQLNRTCPNCRAPLEQTGEQNH